MIEVAIVGAGEVGGSLAHVLARRGIVNRIRLIDPSGQIAAGKALDIMQTGPVERFTTTVIGSPDITRTAGLALLVIADEASGDQRDDLPLLRQLAGLAPRAVVVCALPGSRVLIEQGVREVGWRRDRIIGSAPEALASAVRALVALEAGASVRDVSLTLLGAPPSQTVVNWDDATIAGFAATRVIDEPARRRLADRVAPLWPPGPHVLAHAAAEVIAAIVGVSRRTLRCFVGPDDTGGRRTRAVARPVRLGATGVVGEVEPPLSAAARLALDNAMLL